MSAVSQADPSIRRSPAARTAGIVVLVVGCLVALPLKYAGTAYFIDLSSKPVDVTLEEVSRGNVLLAAGDTLPLIALAIFVVLAPVSVLRRAIGVAGLAAMTLLDLTTVLGSVTLGLDDPLLFGAVMATLFMALSSLAWILVRRRSMLTLVLVPFAAVMGFFFHYVMFASLIYSTNVTPTVGQILSQLILLSSVVAVVWLAVGVDALVSSPAAKR